MQQFWIQYWPQNVDFELSGMQSICAKKKTWQGKIIKENPKMWEIGTKHLKDFELCQNWRLYHLQTTQRPNWPAALQGNLPQAHTRSRFLRCKNSGPKNYSTHSAFKRLDPPPPGFRVATLSRGSTNSRAHKELLGRQNIDRANVGVCANANVGVS